MRPKLLSSAVALTVFGAISVTGIATAGTSAETIVTIKAQNGDISGTVKSPKPFKCAKDRKVVVYKQAGAQQRPKTDEKVGNDTASLQGDRYVWSTGNSGTFGKVYARAPKTPDCKADSSNTIRSRRS